MRPQPLSCGNYAGDSVRSITRARFNEAATSQLRKPDAGVIPQPAPAVLQ